MAMLLNTIFVLSLALKIHGDPTNCNSCDSANRSRFICYDSWQQIPNPLNGSSIGNQSAVCVRKIVRPTEWTEALNDCRSYGAHLLVLHYEFYNRNTSITPDEIGAQIYRYLTSDPALTDMWVGLHFDNTKLFWESDVPIRVTKSPNSDLGYSWEWNQPDLADGQCGAVINVAIANGVRHLGVRFTVTLKPCATLMSYACIKWATDINLRPSESQCLTSNGGWLGNYDMDTCYWRSTQPETMISAQQTCNNMNGSSLAQPIDNYQNNFITSLYDACSSTSRPLDLCAGFGSISSSFYPNVYNNNAHCQWRIVAAIPIQVVSLVIIDLCMEQSFDCLDLYDGDVVLTNNNITSLTGCSLSTPANFHSTRRYMLVVLKSDATVVYRGFIANYSSVVVSTRPEAKFSTASSFRSTEYTTGNPVLSNPASPRSFNTLPSSYGTDAELSADVSCTTAAQYMYSQSNYSGYQLCWLSGNCSSTNLFTCQLPAHINEVVITLHPKNTPIKLAQFPTFQLSCNASNFHPDLPVVWVKDGVYIDIAILPPQGFILNLWQAYNALLLTTPGELQGYYHCEVWSLKTTPQRKRVMSNEALVTFIDVATYYGQATTALDGTTNVNRARVLECNLVFCSVPKATTIIVKVSEQLSVNAQLIINETISDDLMTLGFTVYVNLSLSQVRINSSEGSFMFFKTLIYNELLVASADHLARTYPGLSDGTVTLAYADACAANYRLDPIHFVTFPVTQLGNTASCIDVCVFDGKPLANGSCKGTFKTGGTWQTVIPRPCENSGPASNSIVTEGLQNLSQLDVNPLSARSIVLKALKLTDEVSILTPTDVTYAAQVLSKVVALPQINPEISEPFIAVVNNLANVNSTKLNESQANTQSTSRITKSLALLGDRLTFTENITNVTYVMSNIIFQTVKLQGFLQGYGLAVDSSAWNDNRTDSFVNYLNLSAKEVELSPTQSAIFLSEEALNYTRQTAEQLWNQTDATYQISCIIYRNDNLFGLSRDTPGTPTVNSLILSSSISGTEITNLTQPIKIVMHLAQVGRRSSANCSFWDYESMNWSTYGLVTDLFASNLSDTNSTSNVTSVICYSRHLTNFAVLAGFSGRRDSIVAQILEYISIIGLSLSIAGLSLVILTLVILKLLKKGQLQLVLLQLAIALLAVDILVVSGVDKTQPVAGCKAVAALLLYFLLVAFSWMLVAAVSQYFKFVKVFDTHTSRFMLKTALPAWIGPGMIVAIIAIIDGTGTSKLLARPASYCWLAADAFHFAFLLPLGLIMFVNVVMFVLVIKGITCDRSKDIRTNQKKSAFIKLQVQAAVGCFVIMGLTWLFAFFAINEAAAAFQILFCIFNSLQGFLIFVFVIIRDKSIRNTWARLVDRLVRLLPCQCLPDQIARKPINSEATVGSVAMGRTPPTPPSESVEMESEIYEDVVEITNGSSLNQSETADAETESAKQDASSEFSESMEMDSEIYENAAEITNKFNLNQLHTTGTDSENAAHDTLPTDTYIYLHNHVHSE